MSQDQQYKEEHEALVEGQNATASSSTVVNVGLRTDLSGCKKPTNFKCVNCGKINYSVISTESNKWTCLYALVLSPVFLCFLPFCFTGCKDIYHRCSSCKVIIGYTEHTWC